MTLFEATPVQLLTRAMDAADLRQRVISHNIANVDTPFYKSSDVQFEQLLQKALERNVVFRGQKTDPRHVTIGPPATDELRPVVKTTKGTKMNHNDNNVDIDREMAQMTKNNLWYQGLAYGLNHELRQLRHVITEGRS